MESLCPGGEIGRHAGLRSQCASVTVRVRPGAPIYGDVGKLVTPVDCKSAARKALLVRLQPSPPYYGSVTESGLL